MVSPFRLAREVTAVGDPAKKFILELLTFRELSYTFCFYTMKNLDTVECLPEYVLVVCVGG